MLFPGFFRHLRTFIRTVGYCSWTGQRRPAGARCSTLEEALAGVEDTSEQLHRATESLVLDFLRFSTRTPQIAAFAVLEMGNGAKSWFRSSGRYPDTFVAGEYGEFALRVVGCERL